MPSAQGKERDWETGLDYVEARYYRSVAEIPGGRDDPSLGMFRQVDPLWEKMMDIIPYHYTHNDPVNRVDPDGNVDFEAIINAIQENTTVQISSGAGVGAEIKLGPIGKAGFNANLVSVSVSSNLKGELNGNATILSASGGIKALGSNLVIGKVTFAEANINSNEGKLEINTLEGNVKSNLKLKTSGDVIINKKGKLKKRNGNLKLDNRYKKNGNFGFKVKAGLLGIGIDANLVKMVQQIYKAFKDSNTSEKDSKKEKKKTD